MPVYHRALDNVPASNRRAVWHRESGRGGGRGKYPSNNPSQIESTHKIAFQCIRRRFFLSNHHHIDLMPTYLNRPDMLFVVYAHDDNYLPLHGIYSKALEHLAVFHRLVFCNEGGE